MTPAAVVRITRVKQKSHSAIRYRFKAISVGFPVDSLMGEVIKANVVSRVGGAEQANCIVVRNHILEVECVTLGY